MYENETNPWWDCGETSPKYYFKVDFGSTHFQFIAWKKHPASIPHRSKLISFEIQTFAHRRQWSCRWLAAHNWQSHRIAPGASTAPTERRKDVVPSAEMYECDCMCWHWSSLGNMAQISNQWTCQWKQCRMLWMKHIFGILMQSACWKPFGCRTINWTFNFSLFKLRCFLRQSPFH